MSNQNQGGQNQKPGQQYQGGQDKPGQQGGQKQNPGQQTQKPGQGGQQRGQNEKPGQQNK